MIYPDNKDFIFTIFDDTDVATTDYIKPIYDELFKYISIFRVDISIIISKDFLNFSIIITC